LFFGGSECEIHKNFVNLPGNVESRRSSFDPDILEQLRLWAAELADVADEIERSSDRAPDGDVIVFKRRSAS